MALRNLGCIQDELAIGLADDYSNLHQEMIHLFPGALETLQAHILKENGIIRFACRGFFVIGR